MSSSYLKMVLKYFESEKDYSWSELEKLSGKKEGKWTWPMKTILRMEDIGYEVVYMGDFDHNSFVDSPEEYLMDRYGREMGREQIDNSDLVGEVEQAKEYLERHPEKLVTPELEDIKKLLEKRYLVAVNLNYYPLYGQNGYGGHFVLVLQVREDTVLVHDPGLPPKAGEEIPVKNFTEAWEYPDARSRNLLAFNKR